jgi:hypothetical protein
MPTKVEGRTPHHQGRPSTNTISSLHATNRVQDNAYARQLKLRRAASRRLPDGDPWRYNRPGVAGYADAAAHLIELGLCPAPNVPALRAMWKAGGDNRYRAEFIAKTWELVAA